MTIGERIRAIRRENGQTLEQFAERIKIKPASVSRLERGVNNPADRTIALICAEFGVSEAWLRTGEGDMRAAKSREQEIEAFIQVALSGEQDSFKTRLIAALSKLDESDWDALEKAFSHMFPSASLTVHEMSREQVHAEVDRQLDAEEEDREKGTEEMSGSGHGRSDTA